MKQMKYLLQLPITLLLMVVLTLGCSESDSGTDSIDDPLVGIWRLGNVRIITTDSVLTTTDLGFTQGLVIGNGGEFSLSMQSDDALLSSSGTWTYNATTLIVTYSVGLDNVTDPFLSKAVGFLRSAGQTIHYMYEFTIDGDLELLTTYIYEGVEVQAIYSFYRP